MKNNGRVIAELRREAGYTQKTLAEALNITDKAVSKWERGLALPDVTLLPKLSALLDVDIELLLQEGRTPRHKEWAGLIDLRKSSMDMAQIVYDKPLVYHLLVHFLLVGVRDIYVLGQTEEQNWLSWDELKEMGFRFFVNAGELPAKNLMIMPFPCFLFGSDLTRHFQAAMSTGRLTKLCLDWKKIPFLFCPSEFNDNYLKNPAFLFDQAIERTLGRGMVCIPMETKDQALDIASLVKIYQQHTGLSLQNIAEISQREKNV